MTKEERVAERKRDCVEELPIEPFMGVDHFVLPTDEYLTSQR